MIFFFFFEQKIGCARWDRETLKAGNSLPLHEPHPHQQLWAATGSQGFPLPEKEAERWLPPKSGTCANLARLELFEFAGRSPTELVAMLKGASDNASQENSVWLIQRRNAVIGVCNAGRFG